jgi:pilus assembly protein FimV
MKRPLQLSLAIALALSGTDALALGLGTIHVNSKLNQPLDAEIPILQGTAGEAEGLLVQLAAAEDFDRVGLNRARLTVPLEFSLVKGTHGDLSIKVTSKEPVREPFLDFLVEANWPKGRLLREYTVLLDPPVMAPATGAAVTAAAKPAERAPTQALPEAKPKAPPKPTRTAPVVAAAPRSPAPEPKAAPATPAPKRAAASGEYTVEAGDTLSGIARDMRPDESTNINQLMLALLKQNPNAFFKENINALKRGSILRIPSADQIKATGSASEAAAEVHSQIEDWRGGAAAKPTLVADTGTQPAPKTPAAKTPTGTSSTASTSKSGSERLELVPPKAGKDTVAMADRPGSGAGSSGGSTELKSELARTKEALTSREQEAGELKSRVKELEDTKGKSDRLLSLKDSEIADLQRKLKELQAPSTPGSKSATTTSTTPPATTPSTTATPPPSTASTTPTAGATKTDKVSKEDIWGGTTPPDAKTSAATTPPSSTTSTPATSSTPPVSTSSTATTPSATGSTPATTPTGTTTPPAATTGTTTGTTATPSTPSPTSPTSDTTTAGTTTPSATAPASTTTPPQKPVTTATTPLKTDAKTKAQPLAPTAPTWYEQSWVKPAAIGAAALLLLAGLLGMRKRKAATVTERGSIAGAFGDSPLRDGDAMSAMPESEEQALREQLMLDPRNLGLHLELLSLLYSERNVDAFEQAAEAMHVHVFDTTQPEWLEAKAMGQELAPHNALFSDSAPAAYQAFDDEAVTSPHATTMFDHDEVFNRREPVEEPVPHANNPFDFDLDTDIPAKPTIVPPPSEATFSFDNLAPLDFGKEAQHEISTAIAPEPLPVDEDEFQGEDGVGTKLDLAKAYLDMGDPEGARSMLEEVLAEGNDTQKGEAHKLMAEIK